MPLRTATNDFQTMEIREDNEKTGRFVRTFLTVALDRLDISENSLIEDNKLEKETQNYLAILFVIFVKIAMFFKEYFFCEIMKN